MVTDKELLVNLAENLRRLMSVRKEGGMTQKELEAASGVNQETISRCLNAKSTPTVVAVLQIAEALDTTVEKLFQVPPAKKYRRAS